MKKRFVAFLLVLIMVLGMLPVSAMAASNSTVVLHPSVNSTVTGVKVKVGDTISGHTVSTISGYDITVDLGKYNVNNDTFRLPYAKDIWEGVDNNKVDYISWAGGGSNKRSEGGSALLVNGKNTAYYYFKGATPTKYTYHLIHEFNYVGGTRWDITATTAAESYQLDVNKGKPTRNGYSFAGWADKANAAAAKYFGGEQITLTKDSPSKTIYAVWMPFFELRYDANGGTGAPDSQTYTALSATSTQATFTVPNQTPTKEGYTFKGWADSATATTAQYQPGGPIAVKHTDSPKTVYAVWEESDPQPPLIPAPSYDDLKSAIGQIQVKDVSTPSCGTENYDLIDNTESEPFNWTKTARADQPGKYDVTIKTAPYVAKYNSEKTKTHELNNANQTTLKLVISYENNKWVLDDGLRVIEVKHSEQNPPTDIPNPNPGNIAENLKVKVVCTTPNSGHEPAFYSLIDGTFTHTDIEQSGDYPTCSITISPDSYIRQYSTDKDCPHTTSDQPKTVPLFWNKEAQKWAVNDDQIGLNGVVFNAVCEAVPDTFTVTYTDGVDGEVIFEDDVHTGLNAGDATPAFVGGTPNREGYTFAGWDPEVTETVTETVTYVAKWTPVEPKAPTADDLKKLEMAVQVKCVVDDSQQHTAAYDLLGEYDEDYFVGEPRKDGDDWLCDINYYPERYVAEFNTTFQNLKHVQNDEKIVPVTLIWAGDSWQIKEQGRVHVTEVYTVTYTDGVDGEEVFADQVYSDLRKDSTTPAFNGTPTRTGYTFAGWEPEVAATVTQTVTYVAKWEAKKANVHLMIFKSGDLSKPIVDVPYAADKLAGDTIDLTKIDPSSYLDFDFEIDGGWYDDGMFNSYKRYLDGLQDKPAGLEKLLITGNWQNLKLIVTELVPVVYFDSLESLTAYQNDHSKTEGILRTTKARVGSALPTADAPTATRNGYTFTFWSREGQTVDVTGQTVNGWTNLYANWEKKTFTVKYYLPDETGAWVEKKMDTVDSVDYATYSLWTPDAEDGYEFSGWYQKPADIGVKAKVEKLYMAKEWKLYGKFTPIEYTIQYVYNDGKATSTNPTTYTVESDTITLADATGADWGKTFLEWHDENGQKITEIPTGSTGDRVITAYWNWPVHLHYLDKDNNEIESATLYVSELEPGACVLPTGEKTGYDFDGWYEAKKDIGTASHKLNALSIAKKWELYGRYTAKTDVSYTVKYLREGDNKVLAPEKVVTDQTFDTEVTEQAADVVGYTPDAPSKTMILDEYNKVLTFSYSANTYDYTVRHIKQLPDGSYDEANAEVETLSGKFEALAAVTAKDYGSHYPTNDADTKQNIKIEKNLTIDVKYDLDNHTLTFETNGGSAIAPVTVRHGNAVARPADPTKDKYTFIGWYADPEFTEEYDFATVLEADKTIYAKFELTSTPIGDIYVRYDVLHIKQLPDGTYDLANAEVEHLSAKKDSTVTAVIKDYRATHHVNVNRTLSKLTGTAIQPYKGVDGKPVYTILSVYYDLDFHTLTFDTMGGSKIAPETVRHGLTVAKPKDPVNGGYIFDGWYTDKTFRHRYDFSTPLTEDITIYAKWFLIVLPGVTVKKNTPKLNTADHFAYVQGYPDGTVKPAGNITRAETAAILFRLMDEGSRKTYYSTTSGFRDVASGSWYNTYVATLNNAGVITDSSNGYFRPNEAITRAELAAMLAKFSETTGAANYFNDVSAKYWAANAIAICAKLGWITGYPDGTFRPDKNVTRAELMAMINRATGRAPKSADAFLPGMKTWIDNTSDKWYYLDVQEATNSHSYTVKGSETWTALTSDPNWSLYE